MGNAFDYEAVLKRAKAAAQAKVTGQAMPRPPVLAREKQKQPPVDFDFEAAVRRAREKGEGTKDENLEA